MIVEGNTIPWPKSFSDLNCGILSPTFNSRMLLLGVGAGGPFLPTVSRTRCVLAHGCPMAQVGYTQQALSTTDRLAATRRSGDGGKTAPGVTRRSPTITFTILSYLV